MQVKETTNPKLPIYHHNHLMSKQKSKMKFNWRANWEILLVLVIIVVGIVITTIVAIRNTREKHLLVLPDETDYGQLLAANSIGGEQMPPLQQADFQLQNAQVLMGQAPDEAEFGAATTTSSPLALTSTRTTSGASTRRPPQRGRSVPAPATTTTAANYGQPGRPVNSPIATSAHNHNNTRRHRKYNEPGAPSDAHLGQRYQHAAASQDHYDTMSTESTPSQARPDVESNGSSSSRKPPAPGNGNRPHTAGRFAGHNQLAKLAHKQSHEEHKQQHDDIHTTKSSLADKHHANISSPIGTHDANFPATQDESQPEEADDEATVDNNEADHAGQSPFPSGGSMSTPSLTLHSPYAAMTSSTSLPLGGQAPRNRHYHSQPHYQTPATFLESTSGDEDMMTSYSKAPMLSGGQPGANKTLSLLHSAAEQQFGDNLIDNAPAGLANATTNLLSGDNPSENSAQLATKLRSPQSTSIPFTALLNDLIKMTRASSPVSPQQQQAAIEEPANKQHSSGLGILQQLRSLPGPLLSFLHGHSAPSSPSGAVHEQLTSGGGGGFFPPGTSHDASESSQHYQRISMASPTDFHSILTRTLHGSSILPAFPAPKGTLQRWIPPTSGGSSLETDTMNSNADFVASNVAGFVRSTGQQQQSASSSDRNQQQSNAADQANQKPTNLLSSKPAETQSAELAPQQVGQQQQAPAQQQQQQLNQVVNYDQSQTRSNMNSGAAGIGGQFYPGQSGGLNQHWQQQPVQSNNMNMQSLMQQQQAANYRNSIQSQLLSVPLHNQQPQTSAQFQSRPASLGETSLVEPQANGNNNFQQQFNANSQLFRNSQFDQQQFNLAAAGSTPKASITSSIVSSVVNNKQQVKQPTGSSNAAQQQSSQGKALSRLKRQLTSQRGEEPMNSGRRRHNSNNAQDDDDEEYLDSRPMSIVMPDGSPPMDGDGSESQLRNQRRHKLHRYSDQMATSEQNIDNSPASRQKVEYSYLNALNHYAADSDASHEPSAKMPQFKRRTKAKSKRKNKFAVAQELDEQQQETSGRRDRNNIKSAHRIAKGGARSNAPLQTASSGLMSKLLGVASTNDELEEDLDNDADDDEDGEQRRNKDEADEAEFGVGQNELSKNSNDGSSARSSSSADGPSTTPTSNELDGGPLANNNNNNADEDVSRINGPSSGAADSRYGSGSTGSEAYARRNQQQSDIEFYGHPGEETRTLKYGILGSGNYEVVNGGVYEADESTAAVNSVANYVRKPGLMIAGWPKLFAAAGAGGPQSAAADAFMPGGRVSSTMMGGYLNCEPADKVGQLASDKGYASPLLELLNANNQHNQLFDATAADLLANSLGSSSSSAKTTHTSRDEAPLGGDKLSPSSSPLSNSAKRNKKLGKRKQFAGKNNERGRQAAAHLGRLEQHYESKAGDEEQDTRSSSVDSSAARPMAAGDNRDDNDDGDLRKQQRQIGGRGQSAASSAAVKSQGTNQFNSYQILPSKKNRENVDDDNNSKFIGFDLSTQQLKAIVVDDRLKVCHHVAVNFDQELAEYKTKGGVHRSDDGSNSVSAPVNMWLKALDMCFEKLKIDGLDFGTVLGVSGCAQQHGSVWWRRESGAALAALSPDEYLHKALVSVFSLRDSPVWMDSSTSDECRMLERLVGGPGRMAELTGSRAYERFTGAQIAKVFRRRKEAYLVTERITLVSNFLGSVLCGHYVPFDASDASGMNMMDVRAKRWSPECLEAVVGGDKTEIPGLRMRLGCSRRGGPQQQQQPQADTQEPEQYDDNIVDTHQVVGHVARYFVERYGFPPECLVSSFTGDNPGSMAGLCVGRDELVLSLGTSDTAFFWLEHPQPGVNGHVLRNPIDETQYMGLICFKNGSRTRERIRDQCARGDWAHFSQLLEAVPRGNFGNIGFYFDLREIYPLCQGDFRYNKLDQRVESFESHELEVRACLEGQFLRLFHHSQSLGLDMARIKRVLVTGGASSNKAILQVAADVFRSPVYTLELPNSASLGGAYLAKYAYELEQQRLDQLFKKSPDEGAQPAPTTSDPHGKLTTSTLSAGEKQIDFTEMVLGSDEGETKLNLLKVAEPTPIGSSLGDVYEPLLRRYTRLEAEMSLNNDETLSN